jgi:chemotaxis protein CheC
MRLSEEQNDLLMETINISFGLAASLIGDMLNNYVDLKVPKIDTIPICELSETILKSVNYSKEFYATKQRFYGSFSGEVIFSFDEKSAHVFTELLLGSQENINQEVNGVLLELTNILTASCIGQLSQITGGESIFAVPDIQKVTTKEASLLTEALEYDNVIVITTSLDVANQNIHGHMFVLLNNKMLETLIGLLEGNAPC